LKLEPSSLSEDIFFRGKMWINTPYEKSSNSTKYYDWKDGIKISKNPKFERDRLNIKDVMNF
jgi:hypothetical protein